MQEKQIDGFKAEKQQWYILSFYCCEMTYFYWLMWYALQFMRIIIPAICFESENYEDNCKEQQANNFGIVFISLNTEIS